MKNIVRDWGGGYDPTSDYNSGISWLSYPNFLNFSLENSAHFGKYNKFPDKYQRRTSVVAATFKQSLLATWSAELSAHHSSLSVSLPLTR